MSTPLTQKEIARLVRYAQQAESKALRVAKRAEEAQLRLDEMWELQLPPELIKQRCKECLAARTGPERVNNSDADWTWFGVAVTPHNDMRGCCAPSSRPRRLSVVDDYDDDQASFDNIVRAYEEMYD